MAKHEFGIMNESPVYGVRYDSYEPEKYELISVDDAFIEPLLPALDCIDFFWHALEVQGRGLAYCGITLIPPQSLDAVIETVQTFPELCDLINLLIEAKRKFKFVIHYGL